MSKDVICSTKPLNCDDYDKNKILHEYRQKTINKHYHWCQNSNSDRKDFKMWKIDLIYSVLCK